MPECGLSLIDSDFAACVVIGLPWVHCCIIFFIFVGPLLASRSVRRRVQYVPVIEGLPMGRTRQTTKDHNPSTTETALERFQ